MSELSVEAEGRIIDLLIEEGLVDYAVVDNIKQRVALEGGSVIEEMLKNKLISNGMVSHAMAVIAGVPYVELKNIDIDQDILGKVPRDAALRVTAVPIGEKMGCSI